MDIFDKEYKKIFEETGLNYSDSGVLEDIAKKYTDKNRSAEAVDNAVDAIIMIERRRGHRS